MDTHESLYHVNPKEASMRFSHMFIPTMRESPAEASAVSHALMLRGGYVRQLAAGLFIFLPLGWRVLNRVNRVLKEEMEEIGGQEITMPVLHPAEVWQQTGRWDEIKEEMFRLKDRTGRDMCLGMTHEEIMTWLSSKEIRSYRDLPQVWYQIQTKLRDEARPRSGLLRTREFLMKDSYSFDVDEESLEKNYNLHAQAYHRIFSRCGLKFYQVESDPGMMGGATAHEFMAPSPAGEDEIVICDACGYIANVEIARSVPTASLEAPWAYEEIETPDKRTVKDVSSFLELSPLQFIKSLLYMTEGGPVLALVRGDQEVHEKKLAKAIGPHKQATREEALAILGIEAGFIGPMGHKVRIVADPVLQRGVYVSGANRHDYHAKGIRADIHFKAEWVDLHLAMPGDGCPNCGGALRDEKVIEVGNIFRLGTKYSVPLHAVFLDREGNERPIVMGSYGIGPARIASAAVEQNYDKDGIVWPKSIAPFDVEIVPVNVSDARTVEIAGMLYDGLRGAGLEVLMDDRDERPGVKFKDADLIGIPLRLVVGAKNLAEGRVEMKLRREGTVELLAIDAAVERITAMVREAL